jgi:DNA (cytosine-5)-methyltransferase 1
MKILDLFCGAGGAAMGMHYAIPDAEIIGVDVNPQPRYPFKFIQADAMTFDLDGYDFIWASPPCQCYSSMKYCNPSKTYPDLIPAVRGKLRKAGRPYIIENVVGAPLINPVLLCGEAFGLKVYRHRLFESSIPFLSPGCPGHPEKLLKQGRGPTKEGRLTVGGNFKGFEEGKIAMGIDWMNKKELTQAVPPAYSKFILLIFKNLL